ncbi:hypothetical protein EMCRGX_G021396 [Ephydatia muelleri]
MSSDEESINTSHEHLSPTKEENNAREDSDVAIAVPPNCNDDNEIASSGTSALDVLEQLLSANLIGKERAARLGMKYKMVQEALESSRVAENSLFTQVKELGQHLVQQKRLLDKSASFPEGDTTESSRLRQVLLQHKNQLDQTNETIEKLQLEEEKAEILREYNRLPKQEDVEQHIKNLTRQAEELQDEISMRANDSKRHREELDQKNCKITSLNQEIEQLYHLQEQLQDKLINLSTQPGTVPREIDSLNKQILEITAKLNQRKMFLSELEAQFEGCSAKVKQLTGHHELNLTKDRDATQLEDRATLELQLQHHVIEHKALFEASCRKEKEKDKELKVLKKAEVQIGSVQQSVEQLQRESESVSQRVVSMSDQLAQIKHQTEELASDLEQQKQILAQQEGTEEGVYQLLQHKTEEERRLRAQCQALFSLLRDLNKDVVAMTKHRDVENKHCHQTMKQLSSIADEIRTKEGHIGEERKKLRELDALLKDYGEAYDVVKSERNKIHSQIQLGTQLAAELREKIRMLQGEMAILQSTTQSKEKLQQKCSMVLTTKVTERDTQRQDIAKLQLDQGDISSVLEGQREQLHKLSQQISVAEVQMNRLLRQYEHASQERNDLGLRLIERNEEVCVFHEKLNVMDSILRRAEVELLEQEEELKFLRIELSKVKNDIILLRKSVPEKETLTCELVASQNELRECKDRLCLLEAAVENSNNPQRTRMLAGKVMSRSELQERIETLEVQLGEREQQMLEKDLLYEQICRLNDRTQKKVDSHKGTALNVAQQVIEYQARIKDTTHKMMSLVSELSMQQTVALRLQQEVVEKESQLQQENTRLELGEAPSPQVEAEWLRLMQTQKSPYPRQVNEESLGTLLPDGTYTTAQPRPSAYIPSGSGDLPVPKPYGSHAPFKPTPLGTTARHIRKPEAKPIDI